MGKGYPRVLPGPILYALPPPHTLAGGTPKAEPAYMLAGAGGNGLEYPPTWLARSHSSPAACMACCATASWYACLAMNIACWCAITIPGSIIPPIAGMCGICGIGIPKLGTPNPPMFIPPIIGLLKLNWPKLGAGGMTLSAGIAPSCCGCICEACKYCCICAVSQLFIAPWLTGMAIAPALKGWRVSSGSTIGAGPLTTLPSCKTKC